MTEQALHLKIRLSDEYQGLRLDQALAKCFPEYSRSRLTQWIKEKAVKVNGLNIEPKTKVMGGEDIEIQTLLRAQQGDDPEQIPLNIVYEDDAIIIVNKPAGLVVHPGAGNQQGTLLNALLHHHTPLALLPRAGIIHRLDKDTTGLMVIAKTIEAHTALVAALSRREFDREYYALVDGQIIAGGTIDAAMDRHRGQRTKMAVNASGRPAVTHYRCKKRYNGFTLLHVKLETGRTHQIRVHMSYRGYPLVGDALYGWRCRLPAQSHPDLQNKLLNFKRQALHAFALSLAHPITQEKMRWEVPMPDDFADLLSYLQPREGFYD